MTPSDRASEAACERYFFPTFWLRMCESVEMKADMIARMREALRAAYGVDDSAAWAPIDDETPRDWVIGSVECERNGEPFSWVGPCEWRGDHHEFANMPIEADSFPLPTHWRAFPSPRVTKRDN